MSPHDITSGEMQAEAVRSAVKAGHAVLRVRHYREAADHLDRRAPQEEALGHYTEANGYRAAAEELRRLATTPPAGPADTGETV